MAMIKSAFVLILMFFLIGCSKTENANNSKPQSVSAIKFLSSEVLEEAGFKHIDAMFFELFFVGNNTYLLNSSDNMIARFVNGKADRVYSQYGQAGGEFLSASSIFLSDPGTIGIFDTQKSCVLLFDTELNYKDQKRTSHSIRKLSKTDKGIFAFGDFGKAFYARLDDNFNIIDYFGDRSFEGLKIPFEGLYPYALYMGYLLQNGEFADTSWLHVYSPCKVDIIDPISKKIKCSLEWENHYPQTQKTIQNRTDSYSCYLVGKYGKFYVVQNSFSKKPNSVPVNDLIIFSENGKYFGKLDFKWQIISSSGVKNDSRVFFLDDNEDIAFFDLNTITGVPKK